MAEEKNKLLNIESELEGQDARMTAMEMRIEETEKLWVSAMTAVKDKEEEIAALVSKHSKLQEVLKDAVGGFLDNRKAIEAMIKLEDEMGEAIGILKSGLLAHDESIQKLSKPRDLREITPLSSLFQEIDTCLMIREGVFKTAAEMGIETRGKRLEDVAFLIVEGDTSGVMLERMSQLLSGEDDVPDEIREAAERYKASVNEEIALRNKNLN